MALIYGQPNKTVNGTNEADEIHLNGKANAYGKAGDDRDGGHRNHDHRDHDQREITLISTDPDGNQLNDASFIGAASENGRYIALFTQASDVLPSEVPSGLAPKCAKTTGSSWVPG